MSESGNSSSGTERHQCFEPGCSEEFDTLDEMTWMSGKDGRDGRPFCSSCAGKIRSAAQSQGYSLETDTDRPEGDGE